MAHPFPLTPNLPITDPDVLAEIKAKQMQSGAIPAVAEDPEAGVGFKVPEWKTEETMPSIGKPNVTIPTQQPAQPQQIQIPTGVPYEKQMLRNIPRTGMGEIERLNDEVIQRARQLGESEAELAAAEAGELATQKEQLEGHRVKYATMQEQLQKDANKAQGELDAAVKKYSDAKIKPLDVFQDAGSGVMAAIAIAIAGFGQVLQMHGRRGVGPNAAMQALNRAIDRDIAIQKMNIEKDGKTVDMRQNSLAYLYKRIGDMRIAEQAERSLLLNAAELSLREIQARYKSPIAIQKTQLMISQIQQQQAQQQIQFQNEVKKQAFNNYALLSQMKQKQTAIQQKHIKDLQESKQYITQNMEPIPNMHVSREQFKQAVNFVPVAKAVNRLYKQIYGFLRDKGVGRIVPERLDTEKARAQRALMELQGYIKQDEFKGFGAALSESEIARMGLPNDIGQWGVGMIDIIKDSFKESNKFVMDKMGSYNMRFRTPMARPLPGKK